MADLVEQRRLSAPNIYLIRMAVFLAIALAVATVISRQLFTAFLANPFLNGLILFTLIVGIGYTIRQIVRLYPEIRWVNRFRVADPGIESAEMPTLLAPMATMLRKRSGRMVITPQIMRSILDSIATRLDEARDISRYLIGLLVFLGLLGTFWGLLETVSSVANTINALDVGQNDAGVIFEDLKDGLQAPLSGMGTAFSSSLFGLGGSLILGFLDLQSSQSQNRFYIELEDWLSGVTTLASDVPGATTVYTPPPPIPHASASTASVAAPELATLERTLHNLNMTLAKDQSGPSATAAMADLAEGIQGLVHHMRAEQKAMREWMELQARQQDEIKEILKAMSTRQSYFGED